MRRCWSSSEDALVRERYADTPTKELARMLGRTERAVYMRADQFGLRKSAAYLAGPTSGRLRRGSHPASVRHRFKRGMVPWNRGVTGYMGANRTSFRKGRPPQEARNYRPIGAERISKDGYLERKVSDDQSIAPARRWRGVHVLVWEAANCPVPPGFAVAFKPGRRSAVAAEITLDALELVSRAELMRRNTLHRFPKEIAHAIQLRAALNRQINRRVRA